MWLHTPGFLLLAFTDFRPFRSHFEELRVLFPLTFFVASFPASVNERSFFSFVLNHPGCARAIFDNDDMIYFSTEVANSVYVVCVELGIKFKVTS